MNETNQGHKEIGNTSSLFGKELVVVNIGILPFYEDLKKLGIPASHVDWRPPAGGDHYLTALLDKLF